MNNQTNRVMNFLRTEFSIFILATLLVTGCGGSSDTHEDEHAEEEHTENELSIELTQRQIEAVGIEIGAFSYLPLKNTVKANGVLELPPQNKADVSALVSGAISDINVIEGDRVERGQVLATIEDPGIIEIQQDYIDAYERLQYLRQDYERKQQLLDEGVGSQREFQETTSKFRATMARVSGLESKLKLVGLNPESIVEGSVQASVPIRSPLAGYVRVVEVNTGSYVSPSQHLFEIVDNSELHIDLMVYEKDLHRVQEEQVLYFRYTNQPTSELYKGRIFAVGKAFEQTPKAVRVHALLMEEQPNLLPGMYVEAMIVTGDESVLALPEQAVISDGGQSYIFIVEDEGEHMSIETASESDQHEDETHLRAVPVVTGTTDEGYIEIRLLESVSEESRVVTRGAFFVLSEMRKGEGGHGH